MRNSDAGKDFEALFRSEYQGLTRFAYSYVNDEEAAKDIVHNAFLILWQNWDKLDLSRPLRPWLLTLCRNGALDYLKHLKVVSENERSLSEYLSYEENSEEYEQRLQQVREKLEKLGERQREVLVKCFVEGKKYKEVAQELGISINSVKTHISRGLSRLRDELSNEMILLLILMK